MGRILFCKGLSVKRLVVRLVGLPAGENDAYPFVGQGTNGTVMGFSSLALTAIKLIRPRRMLHALLGKLMEGLADEFRSGEPSMNPNRFAAALDDRGNSRVFLDVCSVKPAQSIGTKQRQQTRSQLFSSSWKIFEEKMIRM